MSPSAPSTPNFRRDFLNGSSVLFVHGPIDEENICLLEKELKAMLRRAPRLVVDLSEARSIDSAAFELLLKTKNTAAQAGGWLSIVSPHAVGLAMLSR